MGWVTQVSLSFRFVLVVCPSRESRVGCLQFSAPVRSRSSLVRQTRNSEPSATTAEYDLSVHSDPLRSALSVPLLSVRKSFPFSSFSSLLPPSRYHPPILYNDDTGPVVLLNDGISQTRN
jgi:hypothetical protein